MWCVAFPDYGVNTKFINSFSNIYFQVSYFKIMIIVFQSLVSVLKAQILLPQGEKVIKMELPKNRSQEEKVLKVKLPKK